MTQFRDQGFFASPNPYEPMYDIFTYIQSWLFMVNLGKYTMDGFYGKFWSQKWRPSDGRMFPVDDLGFPWVNIQRT